MRQGKCDQTIKNHSSQSCGSCRRHYFNPFLLYSDWFFLLCCSRYALCAYSVKIIYCNWFHDHYNWLSVWMLDNGTKNERKIYKTIHGMSWYNLSFIQLIFQIKYAWNVDWIDCWVLTADAADARRPKKWTIYILDLCAIASIMLMLCYAKM